MPTAIIADSILNYSTRYNKTPDSLVYKLAMEIKPEAYNTNLVEDKELVLINKSDFFAEKKWDYDLNDEIPEQIEVQAASSGFRAGKKFIKKASDFALINKLTGEFLAFDLKSKTRINLLTE